MARRGTNAFTFTELRIVHVFTVGCLTFAQILLPLQTVFYGTITIEWNGLGHPLRSMVFRWFWGLASIGKDGFRWFSTIGPTMEWLNLPSLKSTKPTHIWDVRIDKRV